MRMIDRRVSRIDGTIKLLFKFHDGAPAESVVLFNKSRATACLSSQSGCSCACAFCATGALGFKRDLTPSEITAQFTACLREAGARLSSLVFMGMGEPFLNWENVKRAILILSDQKGFAFPQSRITVSTIGIVPVIKELAISGLKVKLAVSLVTVDEPRRAGLVPMNKKYPLPEVLAAAAYYCGKSGNAVFFEYILFDGLNDSRRDAENLRDLVQDIDCKINLIPYNRFTRKDPSPAGTERAWEFQEVLVGAGIRTHLRREKGSDIGAACGQLAAAVRG
jgi:23S rRNA (adenine2503-C2)-methyltransferase